VLKKALKILADLQRFRIEIDANVATIIIDAPPVNAQDRLFCEELVQVLDILGAAHEVRAIVLTGNGKIFSAGADLLEPSAIVEDVGGFPRQNRVIRAAFDAVLECPKPIICALNGAAIGAGCIYALLCDILVAAEESYVAMTEVDYGLAGGARYVMRAFSPSDARMMIYTGERVNGADLLRMNVASACVARESVLAEAQSLASTIAQKAPLAILAAKRSFSITEEMPLRDGYRYEQTQTALLMETGDTKEAIAAFAEKRKPVFRGS